MFWHILASIGDSLKDADTQSFDGARAMARLRRVCVDAKEALSTDTEAVIPVDLPGFTTLVRLTRQEFEAMIAPAIEDTMGAMRRALNSAGISAEQVSAIVLVGGSSRIPLVSERLVATFGRPIALDTHPKHDVALGAALAAAARAGSAAASPPLPPPPPAPPPAPAAPLPPPPAPEPRKAAPSPTPPEPPKPPPLSTPSSGRRGVLIGVGVAVAVLAAGGAAIALMGGGSGDSGGTDVPAPEQSAQPEEEPEYGLPRGPALPDDTIVWGAKIGEQTGIWRVNATTSKSEPIGALDGGDSSPLLPPDRRTIIYLHKETPEAEKGVRWVMGSDGSNPKPLFSDQNTATECSDFRPGWYPGDNIESSADDKLAVLCKRSKTRQEIRLVKVDGTPIDTLDGGVGLDDVAMSPDGSQVAYWKEVNGRQALHLVKADGTGEPQQITEPDFGSGDADPVWSPDGDFIAFRRAQQGDAGHGLFMYDVKNDRVAPFFDETGDQQDPSWSADGSAIAYKNGAGDLWVVNCPDPGGTGETPRSVAESAGSGGAPSWTNR